MDNPVMRGIDVSCWQGNIDWKAVAGTFVRFAYVRMGFGAGRRGGERDAFFERNVDGAVANGIQAGAYFFSYAYDEDDAKAEALWTLETLEKYPRTFTFPIAYDLEAKKLGKTKMAKIASTFAGELERAGWYAQIYSSTAYYRDCIDDEAIKRYDHWVAQYYKVCTYPGEIGVWQNGDTGAVDGIVGRVDTDLAYKDYPSIITRAGLNGFKRGDADLNGRVDAADARYILRAATGLETPDARRRAAADVDGDGRITPADAREALRGGYNS